MTIFIGQRRTYVKYISVPISKIVVRNGLVLKRDVAVRSSNYKYNKENVEEWVKEIVKQKIEDQKGR